VAREDGPFAVPTIEAPGAASSYDASARPPRMLEMRSLRAPPYAAPMTTAAPLLQFLDHAGVAVFAVSGALAAGRKRLDLLGAIVVAMVTAVGGGTLRDVLLGRHPVFWVSEPRYLAVILGATVATVILTRFGRAPLRALLIADALGVAFFTISGAQITETLSSSGAVIVLMGAITGVAGGVVRDILCNEIPLVLREGRLYATAALAGAAAYHVLASNGVARDVSAWIGMATVAAVRVAAIFFGLKLPIYTVDDAEPRGD
jgi:uncharacterized membrane protein YeiH